MKRSKKYKAAEKQIDKTKTYSIEDAVALLPKVNTASFDATVEMHVNLKLTDKQKKQSIKGSLQFPHQVGEAAKVLVITSPDNQKDADAADFVGGEEMVKKIQDGWSDFDIVIATPEIMPKIAVLGKVLGPKGLMPNPKNNTVTNDLKKTIQTYKAGKINFRADKQGGIHIAVGKVAMKPEELSANIIAALEAVFEETKSLSPNPFKSLYLSTSMGPSIPLDTNAVVKQLT